MTDLDNLRALASAASPAGEHIYTHPRDSNNWKANEAWRQAASPEVFLSLLQRVASMEAAERTLLGRNYTYHGGELWKPPLGKAPDFDRNDRNAALLAEIDAHMRDMWDKRLLPASCWPTDLSRRVSEAAGGPSTLDEIMRKNGL